MFALLQCTKGGAPNWLILSVDDDGARPQFMGALSSQFEEKQWGRRKFMSFKRLGEKMNMRFFLTEN